jgi:8-oxo-dGTP diphosphatase
MKLPYTICFCRCGDALLMLYRSKPPNRHRWNGLGGKRAADEPPLTCVRREVWEEAEIDVEAAQDIYFGGIVTWPKGADPTGPGQGMHAFVAEYPADWPIWDSPRYGPEGLLSWHPTSWVCDPSNTAVVDNIPDFLPPMLAHAPPMEYYCDYRGGHLAAVVVRPLSPAVLTY